MHVGMVELAHDGCLMQELDPVDLTCSRSKCLHSDLHAPTGRLPHSLVHLTKVTRPKMLTNTKDSAAERDSPFGWLIHAQI